MTTIFKKTTNWTGFALIAVIGFANLSSAEVIDGVDYKQGRSNDPVAGYALKESDGKLVRLKEDRAGKMIKDINKGCAITTGVEDIKISQHSMDAASAYFIKDGHLHMVAASQRAVDGGNCPSAKTQQLTRGAQVKKNGSKYEYGVVSGKDTLIVNWVLQENGNFTAWDNTKVVATNNSITDVAGGCYGAKGKSFSKKILFLQTRNGDILTMEEDGRLVNEGRHRDIGAFKSNRKVCQDQNQQRSDIDMPEDIDAAELSPTIDAG